MDTHSLSSVPSARKGHKPPDFFGLLTRRKLSSSHANCKTLEHLFKTTLGLKGCRRRGAGSRGVGPMGQGAEETLLSQGAEKDGKAVGERRGMPFGSVFFDECFYSCLNWLKAFYSLFQS